ncbi:hypothetical protein [Rufibacter tibetensis]|uniref:Uncharacterized protein n=1 Tax=Rufibacter tibetensis TaxID=512763 RepID=A0A0P0CU98_9BACT|nr:hypothetical protein [Rufibacter tibetensis]ALJ00191.1 hypothetical protein DC20_15995 [Rufibacter tibetensis]
MEALKEHKCKALYAIEGDVCTLSYAGEAGGSFLPASRFGVAPQSKVVAADWLGVDEAFGEIDPVPLLETCQVIAYVSCLLCPDVVNNDVAHQAKVLPDNPIQ